MKKFLKSRMAKFCVFEIVIAAIAIAAYLYYQDYKRNLPKYEPFALSSEGLSINNIVSDPVMEGTPEGDLMIAHPEGSKIFAKGGLNYVVAGDGVDEFYFSLCSTKIIDGKVNVIEGFDPKKDKIKIFCGHHEIKPEAIKIKHGVLDKQNVTYIDIKGEHTDTAIILLGDINIQPKDIILNERWFVVPNAPGM